MKPPAFQFYASDFLAGCSLFSMEQRGLYITLLCLQWDHGFITLEDYQTCSTAMAQPLAKAVLRKFDQHEDCYKNGRLEAERKKQSEFRVNRSESGKAGAAARWHSHSTANAEPMANDGSPSPSPSPSTEAGAVRRHREAERPAWEEVKAQAVFIGLAEWKARDWFDEMEGIGWLDYNHRVVCRWQSILARVRTKWEADGRPAHPPAARNGSHGIRPLSPLDIKTILVAKERKAEGLKLKHCSLTANGDSWTSKKGFEEWRDLRREIRQLNNTLSNLA